jgi:23S rRNA (cytidine1920-2'-O)/16S rRNA (cytidine1409-2'-O)-methyltransferase
MARAADLIGLVKPMFELRLATAPSDSATVETATQRAAAGIEAAGWRVIGSMPSPVLGGRGAVEALIHARHAS